MKFVFAVSYTAPVLQDRKDVLIVGIYSKSDFSFKSEHMSLLIGWLKLVDFNEEIVRSVIAIDAWDWKLNFSTVSHAVHD